jgi:hypothetical protein
MAQQHTTTTHTADEQLDFCRDWDSAAMDSGREGLRAWLEKERPHLLRAYDADFLFAAVEATRARTATQR